MFAKTYMLASNSKDKGQPQNKVIFLIVTYMYVWLYGVRVSYFDYLVNKMYINITEAKTII